MKRGFPDEIPHLLKKGFTPHEIALKFKKDRAIVLDYIKAMPRSFREQARKNIIERRNSSIS